MSLDGQRLDPSRYQLVPRTLIFAFRGGKVLLQQVPAHRGAWGGRWNGVGGHVEQGESFAQAARREFREETGLEVSELRLAGQVVVDLGASAGIGFSVFVGTAADGEATGSAEGALAWFSPEAAADIPVVEDLPTLLPRAMACLAGAPPFTAVYRYDDGALTILIDD